jgi:hypothetical protein
MPAGCADQRPRAEWRVDLELENVGSLISSLEGPGAERAVVSLWVQSMMDPNWALLWATLGPEEVKQHIPNCVTDADVIQKVYEGMAAGIERSRIIAEAGAAPALVALLGSGRGQEAEFAAGAIWSLGRRHENNSVLVEAGAVPPLVALLDSPKGREAEQAAGALWVLCRRTQGSVAVAEAGGIPPLVKLLRSREGRRAEHGMGALMGLMAQEANSKQIAKAGAIEMFVKLLGSSKGREAEYAAAVLWRLSCTGGIGEQIVKAGAIEPLVRMLVSRVRGKAESAARALQELASQADTEREIAATRYAIPCLVSSAVRLSIIPAEELLDQMREQPHLAEAFDVSLLSVRGVLAQMRRMSDKQRAKLSRWFPDIAEDIGRYESLDKWVVHVARCENRLLLMSWRRGVVEAHNVARDLEAAGVRESAAKRVKVAPDAEVASSNNIDSEVAAASRRVLQPRKRRPS